MESVGTINMPDVEGSSPLVKNPSSLLGRLGSSKALRTILHGGMVTALFAVIMFAYIYLYLLQHISGRNKKPADNSYSVASLVIQLIAYLALGCLYICNSSCLQEKIISAGFLVFVQFVFLVSSIGIVPVHSLRVDFVSGTNMVAISSYCVWKFGYMIQHCRLKMFVRTILNGVIVAFILVVITYAHKHEPSWSDDPSDSNYQDIAEWLLIQLVAYGAIGCLYICNSSGRKEKFISAGYLVLVLVVFLLWSLTNSHLRPHLFFLANIMAISPYCLWRFFPSLQRCLLDDPGTGATMAAAPPLQQAKKREAMLQPQQTTPFRIKDVPREFSSDEIRSITQDFVNKIGQGASAQVFHGSLGDGTAVAVKRIHMHSGHTEAGEEEFRREVSIIANVHHRSLVRLLGYCLQQHRGGLYLVYPFFENGSLDRWIFNRSDEQRRLLTWPKRFSITVAVARALAYLHKDCHRRILHLDVKPGNILLDGDLHAHVSDFGISLSITRNLSHLTSIINTRGRGTFGYMAPEMLINAVSDRSDVFSYGMTLLELVGGRRNFDPSSAATPDPNLARNLREKIAQGKHMDLVDAAMADVDEEAVKTVVKVALCCIQHERDMRPSMQNVVDMLEGRVAVDLPPAPETRRPSSSAVNLLEPHSISEHGVSDAHGG